MNRLWDSIVFPIIQKLHSKSIVEVGSDKAYNTEKLLNYCVENDAHLTPIDPFPLFDVDELKNKYGDSFDMVEALSLDVLPDMKDYDTILLDGDHNWYTLFNELKEIEKNFNQETFPFIFFHDISWPYARRDLYYNPDNIPEEFLNEYSTKGMYPGESKLLDEGGFNAGMRNAVYENTPKNGVLTGIEDFLNESKLDLTFRKINAFRGLGMMYAHNDEIDEMIDKIILSSNITGIMEEYYTKDIIGHNLVMKKKNDEIKKLKAKNKELSKRNKQLSKKNKELKNKQKEFLSSKSWKLTKPLRNISNNFRN